MSALEIILWVIVALATINAIVLARWTSLVSKFLKSQVGLAAVVWIAFTGLVGLGLWIYVAFVTGYVQFALMVILPGLVRLAANLAQPERL